MIYLYSGTPGSGKSLHVAKKIRDNAMLKRPTIANFQVFLPDKLRKSPFQFISNDNLTPAKLIQISKDYFSDHRFSEGALTLIIDECQIMFNSREWQHSGRADWLSFFTQHRHFGYNIILVAQFDRMIDRQIRSLIEYEYMHRKISNIGIGGFFISLLAGGKLFGCVERWYPLHEKIGFQFFRAKKKYYSIYDSYATFGSGDAGGWGPQLDPEPKPCKKSKLKINWLLPNENIQWGIWP